MCRAEQKKILDSIYTQLNRSDISMSFIDGFNFHHTTLQYFAKAKYIFPEQKFKLTKHLHNRWASLLLFTMYQFFGTY